MHAAVRECFDAGDVGPSGDRWGTAIGIHFALADLLTEWHEGSGIIPSEWGYRQALGGADTDDWNYRVLTEDLERGELHASDLIHAGNDLSRYCAYLDRKGLSY